MEYGYDQRSYSVFMDRWNLVVVCLWFLGSPNYWNSRTYGRSIRIFAHTSFALVKLLFSINQYIFLYINNNKKVFKNSLLKL